MKNNSFCIDVGGTKTAYAVYDDRGNELFYGAFPTLPKNGAVDLAERLFSATKGKLADVCRGVIASPGPLNAEKGIVERVATMGWQNVPIVDIFREKFGVPFLLLNDCNAGAIGSYESCAKGKKSVVYVSVSTGIGGGIVIDGELYNGKGNAAEIGHLPVAGEGLACGCGKNDCLELYASGTGIENRYAAATKRRLSCAEIADSARAGDEEAIGVFRRAGESLAFALRSVAGVLDPEEFIFGGSVCKAADLFFPIVRERCPDLSVKLADCGEKQVILGAYEYGKKHEEKYRSTISVATKK